MTDVVNATPSRIQLTVQTSQQIFGFNFTIEFDTDLQVFYKPQSQPGNEIGDLLVLNLDYTVIITGATGGVVTLINPTIAGDIVTIQSNRDIARVADFGQTRPFSADNLNEDLNNVTLLIKQVNTFIDSINLRYDYSELIQAGDLVLPNLNPGYGWVKSTDGSQISQAPFPPEDSSAAQLRADLAANTGAGLSGTTTGYGTVQQALTAIVKASPIYALDSSVTPNSIVVAISPAPSSASNAQFLVVKVANAITGSSVTITINSLSPINVVNASGSGLQTGDILTGIYELFFDGTNYRVLNPSGNVGAYPPMFQNQANTQPNAIDPLNDIDFLPGYVRDLGNNVNAILTYVSVFTKGVDSTWALGNGAGGLASADYPPTPGATLHHFWLIKADGTINDGGFTSDITGQLLLNDAAASGYVYVRRRESAILDADAHWRPYQRIGDYVYYLDDYSLYNLRGSNSSTPQVITLPIPAIDCTALAYLNVDEITNTGASGQRWGILYPLNGTSVTTLYDNEVGRFTTNFAWETVSNRLPIIVTAAQCNYVTAGVQLNADGVTFNAIGWIDKRDAF